MKELILISDDKKIKFASDIQELINLMSSLYPGRLIPEYSAKDYKNEDDISITLEYKKGSPKQLINPPLVKIQVEKYSFAESTFISLQLFERRFEEEGMYCIETSAVSTGKKGILFIGKPRSGKTRLALELYEEGFDFISNEVTLIDPIKSEIKGGTKILNLKPFYMEEIDPKIKQLAYLQHTDAKDYKTFLVDMRNLPRIRKTSKISAIFEIYLYPTCGKGKISTLDEFYVRDRLIDFPTALIRGCYSTYNRFEYFGASLDTNELAKKRARAFFYDLNLNIPTYFIAGDLNFVKEKVIKIVNKL